ncbi:MAG: 1-aminocyclopropane-1-carboxylate deaminase, partial [Bacteroidia bacterium]|nr:1-aminocyclopropane-1-carboxylate deaminase [Bacteroidia bacterium]
MDRPMALPASPRRDTVWMNGLRGRYEVQVLRLDTIHPLTGGNKWFKLQENIRSFQSGSFSAILSFGGHYSNHIAALAEAGRLAGIPTIG